MMRYFEHFVKYDTNKSILVGTDLCVQWGEWDPTVGEVALFFDMRSGDFLFKTPVQELKKIINMSREEIIDTYIEELYFAQCPYCEKEQEMRRGQNTCAQCHTAFFVFRSGDDLNFFDEDPRARPRCGTEDKKEEKEKKEEEELLHVVQTHSLHDATLALMKYAERFQTPDCAWRSILSFAIEQMAKK